MTEQEMVAKLILCGGVSLLLGLILALPVTLLFRIFQKILVVTAKQDKLRDKAIQNSHIIKAELIKSHEVANYNPQTHVYGDRTAVYEYTYGQKIYHYRCMSDGWPEKEIKLYYLHNPKKAAPWGSIGMHERVGAPWVVYYLISAFLVTIILFVTGMKFI